MACDNCDKPTGFQAWEAGMEETYSFHCKSCMREYCAECLKLEPTYSADGEYDENGPRDCSSLPTCRWCREREGHIDDCPVWCGEPCACAKRFEGRDLPDSVLDARECL